MRLLYRGGLALALCLGLAMLHGRAQSPTPGNDDLTAGPSAPLAGDPGWRAWAGRSAAHRLTQQKQLQMEREAREKEAKANAAGGTGPVPAPPPLSLAEERVKEQNAYFRRLEVCNKLMQIALQSNDSAMLRQIEQLEKETFELYQRRTGLASSRPAVQESQADEQILDAKIGPKSAETGMILPTPPSTGKKPASVARKSEGKP